MPYEEDHRQGKDRPVLVIGRDGDWLLALMLTSKDHDRDHAQEARHGRRWQDIGSGAWDSKGRPSEVRVDRILRVDAERGPTRGCRPRPRAVRPGGCRGSRRALTPCRPVPTRPPGIRKGPVTRR